MTGIARCRSLQMKNKTTLALVCRLVITVSALEIRRNVTGVNIRKQAKGRLALQGVAWCSRDFRPPILLARPS
jgi:hypothetical protein